MFSLLLLSVITWNSIILSTSWIQQYQPKTLSSYRTINLKRPHEKLTKLFALEKSYNLLNSTIINNNQLNSTMENVTTVSFKQHNNTLIKSVITIIQKVPFINYKLNLSFLKNKFDKMKLIQYSDFHLIGQMSD